MRTFEEIITVSIGNFDDSKLLFQSETLCNCQRFSSAANVQNLLTTTNDLTNYHASYQTHDFTKIIDKFFTN
jgi:hypothetical protein